MPFFMFFKCKKETSKLIAWSCESEGELVCCIVLSNPLAHFFDHIRLADNRCLLTMCLGIFDTFSHYALQIFARKLPAENIKFKVSTLVFVPHLS